MNKSFQNCNINQETSESSVFIKKVKESLHKTNSSTDVFK